MAPLAAFCAERSEAELVAAYGFLPAILQGVQSDAENRRRGDKISATGVSRFGNVQNRPEGLNEQGLVIRQPMS
jgi:hypothetical protein